MKSKENINKVLSTLVAIAMGVNNIIPFANVVSSNSVVTTNLEETKSRYRKTTSPKLSSSRLEQKSVSSSQTFESKKVVALSAPIPSMGDGQPETNGTTANFVNVINEFTGDLNYSIPLMDVEGFPIVLSYNPNVSMEQEASWVGLGWDLSLGSINRDLRGVPDDFSGDEIIREVNQKDKIVAGSSFGMDFLMSFTMGIPGTSVGPYSGGLGLTFNGGLHVAKGSYFNNYTGAGETRQFGLSTGINFLGGGGTNASVGVTTDTQNGVGYVRSLTFHNALGNGVLVPNLGGFHRQRSVTLHSRNGMKIKADNKGYNYGMHALSTGYMTGKSWGSYRSFGVHYYTPSFNIPKKGARSSFLNYGAGFGSFIVTGGLGFSDLDYAELQRPTFSELKYPAFGYNNMSKGHLDPDNAMLDYNRNGNEIVNTELKTLSFSAPTYDMFLCSAPGLQTSFRSYRYDAFEIHSPTVTQLNSISGESKSNVAVLGLSSQYTNTKSTLSGSDHAYTSRADGQMNLKAKDGSNRFDNKEYYLRTVGEPTLNDNDFVDQYGGLAPSYIALNLDISNTDVNIRATNVLVGNSAIVAPTDNSSFYRPKNAIHYKQYTIEEIGKMAPRSYGPYNCEPVLHKVELPSVELDFVNSDLKKSHHLGGVEVINQDGLRFVFGLPTYSYEKSDVTFSSTGLENPNDYINTGLLEYNLGDNSPSNIRGRASIFDKTTIPAFASGYLLTEMYSSDYMDRTNNGPTEDDLGNYYKLNYTNIYGEDNPYMWRMPMCSDQSGFNIAYNTRLAYLNKNFNSDKWDDVASYSFGTKDMYYAASVESKNYVAYFCLEDRLDQFSMKTEDGGLDTSKPGKLLKKIVLYAKNDIKNSNNEGNESTPLQIIEFEYDYSLCKMYVGNTDTYISGAQSGKLTLKAIYTYTGDSPEYKTTPIEFEYSNINPDFKFNSMDRWGNYKPNDIELPNHEFPYSDQSNDAITNIQAWKLTKVKETNGRIIEFAYAPDSYGFVQDKHAMRMFSLIGMSNTDQLNALGSENVSSETVLSNFGVNNTFRNPSDDEHEDHYNVVYFELDKEIGATSVYEASKQVVNQYFRDENGDIPDEIYFNMYAQLGNRAIDKYEFVQSSVKLGKLFNSGNYIGVVGNTAPFKYGYFILEPEDIHKYADESSVKMVNFVLEYLDKLSVLPMSLGPIFSYKVNPLQIGNWQHGRLNVPCTVYGDIDYNATTPTDFCNYHLSNDWNLMGFDLHKRLNKKGYGLSFHPKKSLVRLFEPDDIKYGGNCRVTSIKVSDQWNSMSGEVESNFIKKYKYFEGNRLGTSGVAAYEPVIGNDENPFFEMVGYSYERERLPNEVAYQIFPWGELVFPAPIVGYDWVSVELPNQSTTPIGKVVKEFYTLKDVPTIAEQTVVQKLNLTGESAVKVNDVHHEVAGFSQGFYVETSDYHGKPKSEKVIGQQKELVSSVKYNYFDHKSKSVNYLDEQGNLIKANTPREIDIYSDSWNFSQNYVTIENSIAKTFSLIMSFIPAFKITHNANSIIHHTDASAYTFSKLMHHSAMLKSIEKKYLGMDGSMVNVVYDAGSGRAILGSTKDEFDDSNYGLTYPAYWKYETLGNMNINDGAYLKAGSISGSGNVIQNNATNGAKLFVGDQLEVDNGTIKIKAWVLKVEGNDIYLVDEGGSPLSGVSWPGSSITVKRSGRKNMLGTSMMAVSTKKNPVNSLSFTFPTQDVIEVSAVQFEENKNLPCIPEDLIGDPITSGYTDRQYEPDAVVNPFKKGVMGNYRLSSTLALQTERSSGDVLGIRQDGKLVDYMPFYALNNGKWYSLDEINHPNYSNGNLQDWRVTGIASQFDEFGKPIETTDPLGNSSSVLYGMNHDLKLAPKASVVNAKLNEVGFDGFEDYNYFRNHQLNYLEFTFTLEPDGVSAEIDNSQKHTGNYSLKLNETSSFSFPIAEAPAANTEHITNGAYRVQECDCIKPFAPGKNKEYYLSVWTKENTKVYPFSNAYVSVNFLNSSGAVISTKNFFASGAVIDGWQKIEGDMNIPFDTEEMEIVFNSNNNSTVWFDDFRIHPVKAAMNTVVYDQNTLLPMASHDAYNYSTFYNYDKNHQLVNVKIETVKGIQTVAEYETGTKRK